MFLGKAGLKMLTPSKSYIAIEWNVFCIGLCSTMLCLGPSLTEKIHNKQFYHIWHKLGSIFYENLKIQRPTKQVHIIIAKNLLRLQKPSVSQSDQWIWFWWGAPPKPTFETSIGDPGHIRSLVWSRGRSRIRSGVRPGIVSPSCSSSSPVSLLIITHPLPVVWQQLICVKYALRL